MKKFIPFAIILSLALGQDSLDNKIVTDHYFYPTEGLQKIVVELSYQLGEARVSQNKQGGITGKVKYQPKVQQPVVKFTRSGDIGYFELDMVNSKEKHVTLKGLNELENLNDKNSLEFFFPVEIPHEIHFEMGLGEADIDLTGITIEELEIETGVSDVQVYVGEPNKMICRKFDITNGIGDFSGKSLGNLRAERVNIEVGLGSMDMDFSGSVFEDLSINAEVGLGSLDIILPEEVNGYVDVNKSFLSSVSIPSGFTSEKAPGRKTVQLNIDVGVGSVDIRQR